MPPPPLFSLDLHAVAKGGALAPEGSGGAGVIGEEWQVMGGRRAGASASDPLPVCQLFV